MYVVPGGRLQGVVQGSGSSRVALGDSDSGLLWQAAGVCQDGRGGTQEAE